MTTEKTKEGILTGLTGFTELLSEAGDQSSETREGKHKKTFGAKGSETWF